jgi:hypothetical protein
MTLYDLCSEWLDDNHEPHKDLSSRALASIMLSEGHISGLKRDTLRKHIARWRKAQGYARDHADVDTDEDELKDSFVIDYDAEEYRFVVQGFSFSRPFEDV